MIRKKDGSRLLLFILAIILVITVLPVSALAANETDKIKIFTMSESQDNHLISYSGHQQSIGNLSSVTDGEILGVTGQAKRLEAIQISKGSSIASVDGSIEYRVHIQSDGTQNWVSDGALAGTTGQSKRIEAIQIRLTGDLSEQYDIYYSAHIQKYGWTEWTKGLDENDSADGTEGWCGTNGLSLRMEAICIVLKEKGTSAPTNGGSWSYLTKSDMGSIVYSGHQQSYGDLCAVSDGVVLGTTGQAKRMEAISISLSGGTVSGSIQYRTHVQSYGWQNWKSDGAVSGTVGQSKRLEAIEIKLSGDIENYCDVWYRVHVEKYGWLGWAKNGQTAGTTGISYRIESIEIQIVPKAANPPGDNSGYYMTVPKYSSWAGYLNAAKTSSQLIIVSVYNTSYATVSMHLKKGNDWVQSFSTTGRVGSAGIGKTQEGDKKTPTGVYSLHTPFGIQPNPGCPLTYVQVNTNHYWGGGVASYYNILVDASKITNYVRGNAEHLIDYGSVYNYCVAVGYNMEQTMGKGSAIFLHCGSSVTSGCISIPESYMISVLQNLTSDAKIIIDYSANISEY